MISNALKGKTILITRDASSSSSLASYIQSLGGNSLVLPLFEIKPTDAALENEPSWLKDIQVVVFTSHNAVNFFFDWLGPTRLNNQVKYFGVGSETIKACSRYGITSLYSPSAPKTAEELFSAMASMINLKNKHVLYPRAKKIKSRLSQNLVAAGAYLHEWVAYENIFREAAVKEFSLIKNNPVDWVTFFSPSAVNYFYEVLSKSSAAHWLAEKSVKIASIGKVTSAELLKYGFIKSVEGDGPSSRQMIEKMIEWETRHAKIL